jgi:hypothetical protein
MHGYQHDCCARQQLWIRQVPERGVPDRAAHWPTPPPVDVYHASCDAVRAAGAAPLYRGQPGYRCGLDRDGDGVACEV